MGVIDGGMVVAEFIQKKVYELKKDDKIEND